MKSRNRGGTSKGRSGSVDPSTKLKRPADVSVILSILLSDYQSPTADCLKEAIARKDFGTITVPVFNIRDGSPVASFAADYLLASLFKKYQDFDLGINREEAALNKWLRAELDCASTNERIRKMYDGGELSIPHRVSEVYHLAKRKVHTILRNVDYGFIRENCRFGPGSDLSTSGDFTSSYNKFASPGNCTPYILPLYSEIFSEDFREDYVNECELVDSSRLTFVPKTAVIDRAICVEPRWNIYLQLGIGQLISKRLFDYGLDLQDQTRNQELARLAHVYGLATIDLSSASDTVSKNLVLDMLPDEWSDLIFKSRCPITTYRGKRFRLEKVSSMGNGYTFPLESLLFLAFCEAACDFMGEPRVVGTYGDDLVVPQAVSPLLIETLNWFGFTVNTEKSFTTGEFFESCGKDFYRGVNVRPFFIKKKVSSVLDHMILSNQIVEYTRRLPDVAKLLHLRELRNYVVNCIPKQAQLRGPIGMAGVIHSSFDECRPNHALHGWEGWLIDTWKPIPVKRDGFSYFGHLFSKLHDDVMTRQGVIPRSHVRWRKKVTYVPTYGDFTWV